MPDFPSNSQRQRKVDGPPEVTAPEKAKVSKVVEGEVVLRKKSLGKRFRETFIAEDGMTIREYIIADILVPTLRNLIYDVTIGSVERALFRDGRPSGPRYVGGRTMTAPGGVRYDLAGRGVPGRAVDPRQPVGREARVGHLPQDVIFPNLMDAEAVLTGLFDILEQYNEVKVSDFYELAGLSSNFTDERWGWSDLRGTRPVRTRNGFILDLPRTEHLER